MADARGLTALGLRPATRTDRLADPAATTTTARDGALVIETPSRSDYRFGNLLVVPAPATDADLDRHRARWQRELLRHAVAAGARQVVVVCERDGDAERVYQRLGCRRSASRAR